MTVSVAAPAPRVGTGVRAALQAVNFFMADMQAGIGPFVGVLLLERGWSTGLIGALSTLGGVAGMIAAAPAGAMIDATRRKRSCVIVAGLCAVGASGLILVSERIWVIAGAQVAGAIAGAVIGPAVMGITLGVVRQAGFFAQNGRNQACNHAGNVLGAGLSGLLGWRFGFAAVFWLAALFAVFTVVAVLCVPSSRIDHRSARGASDDAGRAPVEKLRALLECRPLLALAGALLLFHLGNAAMLPLYGLAVVVAHGNPFTTVASTVVIAQVVMIVASLAAMRIAGRRGYWVVILIAFLALPVRGLIAATVITGWGVVPVQILDGVGTGLLSVAVPGLVARLLDGTGHINIGQGAVLTTQGIGAALSSLLGGMIAQHAGFRPAFLLLSTLSLGSLLIWWVFAPTLRRAGDAGATHRRLGGPAREGGPGA